MAKKFPKDVNAARNFKIIDRTLVRGDFVSSQASFKTFVGGNPDYWTFTNNNSGVPGTNGAVLTVTDPTMNIGGYSQFTNDYVKATNIESGVVRANVTIASGAITLPNGKIVNSYPVGAGLSGEIIVSGQLNDIII